MGGITESFNMQSDHFRWHKSAAQTKYSKQLHHLFIQSKKPRGVLIILRNFQDMLVFLHRFAAEIPRVLREGMDFGRK